MPNSLIYTLEPCEFDDNAVHKLIQWRISIELIKPQEIVFAGFRNKVSFDWLPTYIKYAYLNCEILKKKPHIF